MAEVYALRREKYEDEDYFYEKVWCSNGGIAINKHPKHPDVNKDEVLERVGQMFLEAWRKVQARNAENVYGRNEQCTLHGQRI